MSRAGRGQLVLLAAVAIAVALVPMLLAVLQLGYHPSVAQPPATHLGDVERSLDRALLNATGDIQVKYSWRQRDAAVQTVRDRLEPVLETLNRSSLPRGTLIQVSLNHSLAERWHSANCPDGSARQFGRCEAIDGVVVQDRAGETHVLAAGFEVRVVGRETAVEARTVLDAR